MNLFAFLFCGGIAAGFVGLSVYTRSPIWLILAALNGLLAALNLAIAVNG